MNRVELSNLYASLAPIAAGTSSASAAGKTALEGKADFGKILDSTLNKVSTEQQRADLLQQRYQLGDPAASLEETMLSMQTANISFQSLVQVRNRMVSAYHDIMNMQI
ncbi:MAG: flagellar hook-basal body complex protein FliE [Burkholderiales bacterium]